VAQVVFPRLPAEVDAALRPVVMGCLEVDPAIRWNAEEVTMALYDHMRSSQPLQ